MPSDTNTSDNQTVANLTVAQLEEMIKAAVQKGIAEYVTQQANNAQFPTGN